MCRQREKERKRGYDSKMCEKKGSGKKREEREERRKVVERKGILKKKLIGD